MTKLEVYKIGTKVKLDEDVVATITSVNIRANDYVTYECGWWNGKSHDSKWFTENEISPTETSVKNKIGFIGLN